MKMNLRGIAMDESALNYIFFFDFNENALRRIKVLHTEEFPTVFLWYQLFFHVNNFVTSGSG